MIGDVRGLGLMIGVELVTDRTSKEPAAKQAARVRAHCREQGVLIGVGGQQGNVLRLQPPLVVSDSELDRAADVITGALREVAG
jgi:4-aminobutyrate aminotransferase-like enzyme